MAKERRSRTKAVVILIVVLLLTAVLAYILHLRPARQDVPTPAEVGPSLEEVQGTPPAQGQGAP
jgi:hypothetical protein